MAAVVLPIYGMLLVDSVAQRHFFQGSNVEFQLLHGEALESLFIMQATRIGEQGQLANSHYLHH
jgi:hypothetical protein